MDRTESRHDWYWASARVLVPTARITSSAGPLWRNGRRLISQLAIAVVSREPRAVSLSRPFAARGSSRSGRRARPASASAGAAAMTGSTPLPPVPPAAAE